LRKFKHTIESGKNTSRGCKTRDHRSYHLNTNQWENEIEVIPERDGETSSWKRVEEYRLNKPIS
jgi:hypothetical protein